MKTRIYPLFLFLSLFVGIGWSEDFFHISGVYPHLAMFNSQGECGTGALAPWAGRLWAITYAPHKPMGSDDKLYAIGPDLEQEIFSGSVGGTPANRMIHRESQQLFIGPYVIDKEGAVRVIGPEKMPGRLTGNARHLEQPEKVVYYATMEEGFYEVDVDSLAVRELFPDANASGDKGGALLPGYHGKGLYSGQGYLVYANNGEHSPEARVKPDIASGCLTAWDGQTWTVIERKQFTEVTGPGGIYGNANPETDPVWSVGWDHRSLIVMLLEEGAWHRYRLPKASHAYDGAHGWNTEWPRIRDIGKANLLMTMHGMFWDFPKTFSAKKSGGIAPLSSYLKVVGDFCRWGDQVVLGCDDAAKSEFLNKRKAKGEILGPGQSHSNLRFLKPEAVREMGLILGRGALWLEEDVKAKTPSDPFLFSGYARRGLHLAHDSDHPVCFRVEVDRQGNDSWEQLQQVTVPAKGYQWLSFPSEEAGVWLRLSTDSNCAKAMACFQYAGLDQRSTEPEEMFQGLVSDTAQAASGGLLRVRGGGLKSLAFAAVRSDGEQGYYEMDVSMKLKRVDDPKAQRYLEDHVAVPEGVYTVDAASVLYIDDAGNRYRLPKGAPGFEGKGLLGVERVAREVCTERDLFNCQGTFYELPAQNAGGFHKIRPIATHHRHITDFCSYRGMLVLSGVREGAPENPHLIASEDGRCALWVGEVDDLWKLGKVRGWGGVWKDSSVKQGEASDPYLMTGYDKKRLVLSHASEGTVTFSMEVDPAGKGWFLYKCIAVEAGEEACYEFPENFQAYWVRLKADRDCLASGLFYYE